MITPSPVTPLDSFKMIAAICVDELLVNWPTDYPVGKPIYQNALDQLKTDIVMRLDQPTILAQVDVYLAQDKVPCASFKCVPIPMQDILRFDMDEYITKKIIERLINWNGTFSYMAVVHIGGTTQILYKDA